jgi:type 1 glutamine amidotransferase
MSAVARRNAGKMLTASLLGAPWIYAAIFALLCAPTFLCAQSAGAPFHVLALAEETGIHKPFVDGARIWLAAEGKRDNFTVDYIENTDRIDDAFLSHYQLFIQLNYPPYDWTPTAMCAFERYIDQGRGGWIGFHHAGLLGYFDGFDLWQWYDNFMGGIRYTNYIATFATAAVHVEDPASPIMRGVSPNFTIHNEEWYTWDKSPRPFVHVLATVDEKTYQPDSPIKMHGDHPVIWTNDHVKARNLYIFMGHHPELFENKDYTTMVHNAILWAAHR